MNEIFMRVTTFAESGAFHPFNCRKQRQRDVLDHQKENPTDEAESESDLE